MSRAILYSLLSTVFVFMLASCGGGGSAGIGGTGITSGGTITGFGSIFVNGVEYDTDAATVSGDLMSVANLKLGMVVTVRGKLNSGSTTGTADSIIVDIELKGAITSAPVLNTNTGTKSFTVLGRTVVVSDAETVFDGTNFGFNTITMNDVVEVSGYLDNNGNLQASRVEKKINDTEVEINGIYESFIDNTSFSLKVGSNFLTINHTGISANFTKDQSLEVKGTQSNSTSIDATSIELDDDSLGDNDKIEVEGLITNFISDSDFRVNGQKVSVGTSTLLTPANLTLANNVKVEVEGELVNNVLVADKIEARSGMIEVRANVSAVDSANKTITLSVSNQTITFKLNNQSKLEDDVAEIEPFKIGDIMVGDYLNIKAYDDAGTHIATDIKRRENDPAIKLEGIVTAFDVTTSSITLLGITYNTDNSTNFEGFNSSADFYAALALMLSNEIEIEIELEDMKSGAAPSGDGVADKVEIED